MKWFNKWFAKKCKQAWEDANKEEVNNPNVPMTSAKLSLGPRSIDQQGFNFTVYPAQGGMVIELRVYDHKRDQHNNKLYIVRDDQDLGKELDHIITLEALCK